VGEASERLLLIAKEILALGTTHRDDAADYALTQSELDALRSRIVTFEELVVAPREGVARTAALTRLIEIEVERGMELLRGFFDRILYRFKESDPEFYVNYQTARKVIRPAYRSRGGAGGEGDDVAQEDGDAAADLTTAAGGGEEASFAEVQAALGRIKTGEESAPEDPQPWAGAGNGATLAG